MTAKRYASIAPLMALALGMEAQDGINLVRNHGFEDHTRKVTTLDQFSFAEHWTNATLGLPELFSASAKNVGIPNNEYGEMEPKEGEHYAGFFGWKDDERRDWGGTDPDTPFKPGWNQYSEYMMGELKVPLIEGRTYELSFWVALAQNSDRAISGIGAFLSENPYSFQHRKFLDFRPQVFSEQILRERGKWVEIKDSFVAEGDEAYIIIGAYPLAVVESVRIIEGYDNKYAYYYLDQVVLRELKEETPAEGQ